MSEIRKEQINYNDDITITGLLNVDNLRLNGSTISAISADTNINLSPTGVGSVNCFKYIYVQHEEAGTADTVQTFITDRRTTGNPAAGIGQKWIAYCQSLNGVLQSLFNIESTFTDVTANAENADWRIKLSNNGSLIDVFVLNHLGNLTIPGYLLQAGIFGEIYVADNATSQSIPTGTTYTKITAFDTNGESANCTPDVANDKITITKAGRYRVEGSFSFNSGTVNVVWRGAAFLNGTEQSQVHFKRKTAVASDAGNAGFTGFINVTTVPWDLDFRVRHDNGGSVNLTLEYGNLNVEYMGET